MVYLFRYKQMVEAPKYKNVVSRNNSVISAGIGNFRRRNRPSKNDCHSHALKT